MKIFFWVSLLSLVLISLVLRGLVSSQDMAKGFGDFRQEVSESSHDMDEESRAVPTPIPTRRLTSTMTKVSHPRRSGSHPAQHSSDTRSFRKGASRIPVGTKRAKG
jgi:hypothetical protein